jgi:quercetin dioxygenase-like cupin family protein
MSQLASAPGELVPMQVWEGVTVRFVHGDRQTMAIAELDPGIVVPEHRHPNEQLGIVVQGSIVITSNEEVVRVEAGGNYRFLAEVPHQVEAGPDGAVLIESFCPPRSDWNRLLPADPQTRWPTQS